MSNNHPNHEFQTTHWSMIVSARTPGDSSARRESLSHLYSQYWYPLFAYLRRKGNSSEDSADYVQSFFVELIQKEFLKAVEPENGRFRWFLMSAIGRFVSKQIQAGRTQKRGGELKTFSIDLDDAEKRYALEPIEGWTAEKLYDRRWAIEVLSQALKRLEELYPSEKRDLYLALLPTLEAENELESTYREIAARFQKTEAAVKVFAMRMRQSYREMLRSIVAETVADGNGIDEELGILLTALKG